MYFASIFFTWTVSALTLKSIRRFHIIKVDEIKASSNCKYHCYIWVYINKLLVIYLQSLT